jgi:segregation and condensation protein B
VTRAEIEDIRGVAISRGTVDVLMETGWVRLRGRRKAPGRPVTYGTTETFLLHFGLENITDLPGLDELKSAGLFDGRLPKGFGVPTPSDDPELREDEDPLEGDLFDDLPLGEEEGGAVARAGDSPEATTASVEDAAEAISEAPAAAHREDLASGEAGEGEGAEASLFDEPATAEPEVEAATLDVERSGDK